MRELVMIGILTRWSPLRLRPNRRGSQVLKRRRMRLERLESRPLLAANFPLASPLENDPAGKQAVESSLTRFVAAILLRRR